MVTGLHVSLVVLLGLLCYCNSFSVPFIFDDFNSIVNNPVIVGATNLWDILLHGGSRRIADLSFAVNFRIFGLQVAGYHATNLAIHLSAAVVLYFLSAALLDSLDSVYRSGEPEAESERFIPLATALVFVSHPLQTQAVTYLVQRQTSLATLFYLLALLAYVKGRLSLEQHGLKGGVLRWGVTLSAMALLAFHTKQITYSMPLMILMLELALFRGRLFKRGLIAAAAAGLLLLLTVLLPPLLNGSPAETLFDLRGATSEDLYFSRSSYFLTQARVVVTYLRLLLLPLRQNLDYDYPIYSSLQNAEVIAALILHALMLAAAFVLYRRSQLQLISADRRQGCYLRLIALGIAWFYIALSVESSFIPISDVIMEHRVYLPSAGFSLALFAFAALVSRKLQCGVRYRWFALTALCLIFLTLTIARNRVWNDDVRFWQDVAAKSPRKGRVLASLGRAYMNHNRSKEALPLFVDAIRLDIRAEVAWKMLGFSLQGLNCYQGRFTTGREYLTPEGEVDFRWYRQSTSTQFNNMGLATEFIGQPQEALKWYVQSVSMAPGYTLAWYNLGLLSARLGNYAQRDRALLKLKALDPDLANKLAGDIRPDRPTF